MSKKIIETEVDVIQWFAELEEDIDVWITDPPYPFDNKNGSGRFAYVDGEDEMYTRLTWSSLETMYKEMFDRTQMGGRAYVFANRDGMFRTQESLKNAGWTLRNMLIWDKQHFGGGYHWRNQAEYIIYVSKGRPKTYIKKLSNIFNYKRPTKNSAIPAIGYNPKGASCKPIGIWKDIIDYGVIKDDVIADPFSGSNPMRAALLDEPKLLNKIRMAYTNALIT